MLTIVNKGSSLTVVNEGVSLTILNEGLLLTIVNETTNFIKMHATLLLVVLNEVYSCRGVKTPWCFLKNYSMISTDALPVGFLSSLTIVNEGVIVNDRYNEGLLLTIFKDDPSLTLR